MNKKALYENIMKNVAKLVKKALDEDSHLINGRRPIGFYTLEEREEQDRELAAEPSHSIDNEESTMEEAVIKLFQTMAMMSKIKAAPFKVLVDYLNQRMAQNLPNGTEIVEIDEEHTAILCYTLDDYIIILTELNGRYDVINGEAYGLY